MSAKLGRWPAPALNPKKWKLLLEILSTSELQTDQSLLDSYQKLNENLSQTTWTLDLARMVTPPRTPPHPGKGWLPEETAYVYHLPLLLTCFNSVPICTYYFIPDWFKLSVTMELVGFICTVGTFAAVLIFLVSLKYDDWFQSRAVVAAIIPFSFLAGKDFISSVM